MASETIKNYFSTKKLARRLRFATSMLDVIDRTWLKYPFETIIGNKILHWIIGKIIGAWPL